MLNRKCAADDAALSWKESEYLADQGYSPSCISMGSRDVIAMAYDGDPNEKLIALYTRSRQTGELRLVEGEHIPVMDNLLTL